MKTILLPFSVLILLTLLSTQVNAATYTTLAAGDWANTTNVWSLDGVTPCGCTPGPAPNNDQIIINHDITANQTIGLVNNSSFLLNTSGSFTSNNELSFTNATASINADITVNKFLVDVGSDVSLNSALLTISARVDIYGTINIDGGYTLMNGGNVELHPGSELNLDNSGKLDIQGGNITNSGTIDLCGTCCITTSGNWRNNSNGVVQGSGAARSENGNMRNFGQWAFTVAWCSSGNQQGMPGFENCFTSNMICNLVILPVEFGYIEATSNEAGVPVINWGTISERNNDYFILFRRTASGDWKEISRTAGAGTTTEEQHYSSTDPSAPAGNQYYKIQQVDYNGATTDSEAVSVRVEGNEFIVAPNPTNKSEIIQLYNVEENSFVELLDGSGKVLWASQASHSEVKIPLSSIQLEGGLYFIRTSTKSNSQTKKLVVY